MWPNLQGLSPKCCQNDGVEVNPPGHENTEAQTPHTNTEAAGRIRGARDLQHKGNSPGHASTGHRPAPVQATAAEPNQQYMGTNTKRDSTQISQPPHTEKAA